jgi:hypothetical protein
VVAEALHLIHDFGNRPSAFLAARIRDDAEGATHVTALHDRDEGGGIEILRDVIANGILRTRFFFHVANAFAGKRELQLVHPPVQAPLEDRVHVVENLVILLGANDHVEVRDPLEQLRPAALRHAAHEAENHVRLVPPVAAHAAHLAERLLLGLIAHRAGIHEDRVGIGLVAGDGVAALGEHLRDLFGVALVHLATVGADKNLGHG